MKLSSLFRTPPPPHAFAAEASQLRYGRLDSRRETLEKVESAALPPGWFQLGPVGLLQLDQRALAAAVAGLVSRCEKPPQRAALVVPNSWVRSVVMDVGPLSRHRDEAEESVRWRLKKLLPCRPEDVRLDYLGVGDNGRLLVVLALDKPLRTVEETFASAGVQLVRVEPLVLAVAPLVPRRGRGAVLLAIEDQAMGVAVTLDGTLRWLRQKTLPDDGGHFDTFLLRELSRTFEQTRQILGPDQPLPLWVVAERPGAVETVRSWAETMDGVAVETLAARSGAAAGVAGLALLGSAYAGEAV